MQSRRKFMNAYLIKTRCSCGACPGCRRRIGRLNALAGNREQFGGRRPFEEDPAAAARLEAAGRIYQKEREMYAPGFGGWPL